MATHFFWALVYKSSQKKIFSFLSLSLFFFPSPIPPRWRGADDRLLLISRKLIKRAYQITDWCLIKLVFFCFAFLHVCREYVLYTHIHTIYITHTYIHTYIPYIPYIPLLLPLPCSDLCRVHKLLYVRYKTSDPATSLF